MKRKVPNRMAMSEQRMLPSQDGHSLDSKLDFFHSVKSCSFVTIDVCHSFYPMLYALRVLMYVQS